MEHMRIFYGFDEETIKGIDSKISKWLLKMGDMIEIVERKQSAFSTGINAINCIAIAIYYKTNF